jgi:hypothetical protein
MPKTTRTKTTKLKTAGTKTSKPWDKLYATTVEPEEILYVVTSMTRLHEEGKNPDFNAAMSIITDRYKKKKNGVEKSFAIIQRIHCLLRVLESKDERMRGWTTDSVDKDCMLTNQAVFTATALCPMKKNGAQMCFDADEFFDIVLRESDAEGRG